MIAESFSYLNVTSSMMKGVKSCDFNLMKVTDPFSVIISFHCGVQILYKLTGFLDS